MTATITDRNATAAREPLMLNRSAYLRSASASSPLDRAEIRNRIIVGGQRIYGNVNVSIEALMGSCGYTEAERLIVEALVGDVPVVAGTLVFDTTGQSKSWWECGIFLQVRVLPEAVRDSFADIGVYDLDSEFDYLDSLTGRSFWSTHLHVGKKLPHPNPKHPSHTNCD